MTTTGPPYVARHPGALSRTLIFWLCADIVTSLIGALLSGLQLAAMRALDPGQKIAMSMVPPGTNELLITTASLPILPVTVITGFLALKWIYRVNLNAHTLARGLVVSPAWNVGWFFVPIAYLWKPFQGVSQSWQATVSPSRWSAEPTPPILRWWWGLWLAGLFADNVSLRLTLMATTVSERSGAEVANLIASLLALPADFALILVVRRLCELQIDALRGNAFA